MQHQEHSRELKRLVPLHRQLVLIGSGTTNEGEVRVTDATRTSNFAQLPRDSSQFLTSFALRLPIFSKVVALLSPNFRAF